MSSPASALPKLTYFPAAGRTWGLRIALFKAFGKDGWVDEHVEFKDWKDLKPATPLGSLPTLTLPSGIVMTQCDALTRWAGAQGGLYPPSGAGAGGTSDDALVVDEAMSTAFGALDNTPGRGLILEEKKQAREKYAKGFLSTSLSLLEKRVNNYNTGPFLTGDQLTIGDLSIVMLTDMICQGDFDFVLPTLVTEGFPGLATHRDLVMNHQLVKEYASEYDTTNNYHKGD
jgi:glutathione S-transferase